MFSIKKFLNSFWLKNIAMASMVFDHVAAIIFYTFTINDPSSIAASLYLPFRIIGRLSFVILAFLLIEGMKYTKSQIKYLLRLFSLSLFMTICELIILHEYSGNPITTLFLGALTIYFLKLPKWKKVFFILPLIYVILSDLDIIITKNEYGMYGYFLILGFYFCQIGVKFGYSLYCKKNGLDESTFVTPDFLLRAWSLTSTLFLMIYNLLWYFLFPSFNGKVLMDMSIQVYSLFASLPILFYNGQRGYNKPWYKYGCYFFFPIHIVLIYLINLLIW